jgi:hypothetical protein
MQQNLRVALEPTSWDLRMAGFGKPTWSAVNVIDLLVWYNSVNGYLPVRGGDTFDIVGCPPVADGTISSMDLKSESAKIVLKQPASVVDKQFDTTTRRYVSIAGCENVRVRDVEGNTLTVEPRPTRKYVAGTEVFVVRHVAYSVDTSGDVPVLYVHDDLGDHRPLRNP